jgi:putative phage-type endonuclease
MEQRSEIWSEWRSKGLGGSDAAAVLGICPYKTAYDLWEIKTGRKKEEVADNIAIQRGNNFEPIVRARYELERGAEFPATLVEHERFPFIRASLDGFNRDLNIVLEIKYQGKKDHEAARRGIIRPHHVAQLAHQLLVTGAQKADYVSFDGVDHVIVEYFPDLEYSKNLLKKLTEFWALVETDTPPPLSDRDFKKIKNEEITARLKRWKNAKRRAEEYAEEEARLKKEIIELVDHPRMIGCGVKIQKVFRKGNIDYSKVEELKGVDLERYRKPGSESWMFKEAAE